MEVEAIPILAHWVGELGRISTPKGCFLKTTLGIISVILAAPGWIGSYPSRIISIARPHIEDLIPDSKHGKMEV